MPQRVIVATLQCGILSIKYIFVFAVPRAFKTGARNPPHTIGIKSQVSKTDFISIKDGNFLVHTR